MGIPGVSGPTGPSGESCAIVATAGAAWILAGAVLVAYWWSSRNRHQ